MKSVRIFQLKNKKLIGQIYQGQLEAGRAFTQCVRFHREIRAQKGAWPNKKTLRDLIKGNYALHSQTIQAIADTFWDNVLTTTKLRKSNKKIRYPYKEKRFYPLMWPEQAVCQEKNRLILPMGRGRKSLVIPLPTSETLGACKLVWNDGYELHAVVDKETPNYVGKDANHATVDLGEIHLAAVTTNTGKALVVSGRAIRSLKRLKTKKLGLIARKRSRCKKGSRRYKKIVHARQKITKRIEHRIRDLRHKGTRKVIDFCKTEKVSQIFVGHPKGIRKKDSGRRHNQRLGLWEFYKDIQYIKEKSKFENMVCFTGSERGTSSQCPSCNHKKKARGRLWKCKQCKFMGHRDVVGATNMHPLAFGEKVMFPHSITYLHPGKIRRSSSPDTGQSCLGMIGDSTHRYRGRRKPQAMLPIAA